MTCTLRQIDLEQHLRQYRYDCQLYGSDVVDGFFAYLYHKSQLARMWRYRQRLMERRKENPCRADS